MSLLKNTLIVGGIATAATTVAALLFSRAEKKPATAAINAVSHIAWGDAAYEHEEPSIKHTATGGILNGAAMMTWAGLLQLVLPKKRRNLPETLAKSAAVATAAYVVDYHVVPQRLTPGFEEKLSKKALFGIYAVMAISMAAASISREG
jgi:hypothetical protein